MNHKGIFPPMLRYFAKAFSASPIDDERDPNEVPADVPADLSTNDCPFCSCLSYKLLPPSKFSRAEVQRLVFHEECQSCSSSHAAQIPLCDFCKHLRLAHIIQCVRKNPSLDRLSIDLDLKARALGRTKCDLCDFLTHAMSLPQTGPSEVEVTLAASVTMVLQREKSAIMLWRIPAPWSVEIQGRGGNPALPYSVRINVDHHEAPRNISGKCEEFIQWDVIRRWLSECNKNHEPCGVIRSRPPVPGFRVIDVNKRCVVEREGFCEYMALSYVWGSRSKSARYVEQATCDNIESLRIPGGLTQLPETIEDSITICQKLGIGYLWVDRYCIIQDNAVHKHTQVAAMADIYSSSTVTLIACSGTDGVESGIPGVRRKRRWKKRCINIQDLVFSYPVPHLDQIVAGSIWNTRGWTYQESVLPKRKLIITPMEVWFRCRRRHCSRESEAGPQDSHWITVTRIWPFYVMSQPNFLDYARNLEMYTRRKLSYASDIYNAFHGIAQALYVRDDGFHFGLPEPHFDQALLWYCGCRWNDSRSRCLRSCAETTPSWSWGSVTCRIKHDLNSSFCMTLVKWALYKTQVADMSSQTSNPETHVGHKKELKVMFEPNLWDSRQGPPANECPQFFLALAINEGCIKADKDFAIPWHKSFDSLKEHFKRQWPTYADAYEEVQKVDACQSFGLNGVLFTKAQCAIFHIKSKWIKNATGMTIGSFYQVEIDAQGSESSSSDTRRWDIYEECSSYEQCSADEECDVEGIALSISSADIKDMLRENTSDLPSSLVSRWRGRGTSAYCDMTYFDCKDEPLDPVPVVNVMFIRREDGYARRIGLGWIALKQWGSVEWRHEDIWLK